MIGLSESLGRTCELVSKRIVVAITGASGATYSLRLLQVLKELNEKHME